MSNADVFIEQANSKIHAWKHELIELESRVQHSVETDEQSQVNAQRIIELKSQIAATEAQIRELSSSK
ncbi:MAG: hypothetical protein R3C53_27160 [Pirellulaceae bacterium]